MHFSEECFRLTMNPSQKYQRRKASPSRPYETGVTKPEETATLHQKPMPFQTIGVHKTNSLLLWKCVLSIKNPQNWKENSPLSDREIPIIRKKHVESFRFFPYLVGKKAAFTAFCPIG